MALNIKDPETDRLARELAAATGETITIAAKRAIEERLARVQARSSALVARDSLHALIERGRRRPMLDDRTAESILGYDDHGVPG